MSAKAEHDEAADTQTPANQQTKLELYLLQINILRGEKLASADLNGKSDPYCKIIGNKQFYKTKYIEKTLNPEWNEETQFCFLEPVKDIKFEVWDWDKLTKGDRIGNVTLDVSQFFSPNHKGFEGALQLKDVKTGSIHVKAVGRLILPSELEERVLRLEGVTAKNATLILSHTATINSKKQEGDDLKNINATLTTNKTELLTEQQRLNGEISQLTSINQQLTQDIDRTSNEIETTRANTETKKKDLKNSEFELEQARQRRGELESDNKSRREDIETTKGQLKDKQKKIEDLRDELAKLKGA